MKIKKRVELARVEIKDKDASGVNFYPVITASDGAPNFALRLFEVDPNGNTPYHFHEWEHEVFVIEGSGFIITENKKIVIKKDDYLFIEPLEKHQFLAGPDGLKWICVVPNNGQPPVTNN